jgi:hypothetical protein
MAQRPQYYNPIELARRVQDAAARGVAGGVFIGRAAIVGRLRLGIGDVLYRDPLQFPLDLTDTENEGFFISLRFVRYVKRAISQQKTIEDQGLILLPIPNELNDTTSLNYSNESLGPLLGAGVEAAQLALSRPLLAIDAVIDAGEVAARQVAENYVSPNLGAATSALSGIAINPFMTAVFKNPEFKTHSFSWKFYPRNKKETDELKKIIDTMKFHILPDIQTQAGVLFEYPEMLLIKLHPNDEYTYKFKPSVVKNLTVNFAPDGGPSFFYNSNGAPTAVEIKMQCQEIEYFTKFDYPERRSMPFI